MHSVRVQSVHEVGERHRCEKRHEACREAVCVTEHTVIFDGVQRRLEAAADCALVEVLHGAVVVVDAVLVRIQQQSQLPQLK